MATDLLHFRINKYCSYCRELIDITHNYCGRCGRGQDKYYRARIVRAMVV